MQKIHKDIKLWCYNDKSDKIYNMILLEVEPNKFQVEIEYGPRLKSSRIYRKPSFPTTLSWAENFINEQLREKKRKGYKPVD